MTKQLQMPSDDGADSQAILLCVIGISSFVRHSSFGTSSLLFTLASRRVGKFKERAFEVAAVLLARLSQARFGDLQGVAGLLRGQQRLGGADAQLQLARDPRDQLVEHILGL